MEENKITVKLADYKGVSVLKREVDVTEQEVQEEMEHARTYAAETKVKPEGAAEIGDQTVIDFVGYIDGETFEGGEGEDYPLVLGSNTFIEGFEEQLVGTKAGDLVDVTVSFPEDYQAPVAAGKEAVFKVTVREVRTTHIPELTDEVVAQVSSCTTVDEFHDYVRNQIRAYKEDQNLQEKENEVLTKVVENSDVMIPDEVVEERAKVLKDNLLSQIQSNGTTMDAYLEYNQLTEEQFDGYNRTNALNMLRGQAVLGEIAKAEGMTCSSEELEQELARMAQGYQTAVQELKGMLGDEGIKMVREDILAKRALDLITEQALEE
ncbi:MAG: trigger factor [Lachnospiraceae bacterium]|nr:trigger factor [Lachnospiraceae bacterium]